MIDLIQQRHNSFEQLLGKLDVVEFNLNKELMEKDIDKFKNELKETTNRFNKANLEAIIKYLEKLIKHNKDQLFQLCWKIDPKATLPSTYPIRLIYEELYNINICNYIELDSASKFVDIDMSELSDILAFEFMYRDLGETTKSIEKILEPCGISTYEDSDILIKYFEDNEGYSRLFEMSKILRIEDSPYLIRETKHIMDYFNTRKFKTKTYREVVDYSCRYANTLIVANIVKESARAGAIIKVLSIEPTRIQFMISKCENDIIKNNIIHDVSLRSFGRKFKLNCNVNIY